jgi:hypothetical protein
VLINGRISGVVEIIIGNLFLQCLYRWCHRMLAGGLCVKMNSRMICLLRLRRQLKKVLSFEALVKNRLGGVGCRII